MKLRATNCIVSQALFPQSEIQRLVQFSDEKRGRSYHRSMVTALVVLLILVLVLLLL